MYESPHDIVRSLLRTEKGTSLLPQNQYVLWVDIKANKLQIRKATEEIYKVHVEAVNTMKVKGKAKRVRHKLGYTSNWKKAIVTLKQGDTIEIAGT